MSTTSSEAGDKLKGAAGDLTKAMGERAMRAATDRVGGLTDKFEGIADGGPLKQAKVKGATEAISGGSPVKGALKGVGSGIKDKLGDAKDAVVDKVTGGGGGKGGRKDATKSTNIVESIDVGVPLKVAYNQWTQFGEFPSFMKKVENVDAEEDNKLRWKAQIVWSHRTWEATILEQIPDERIVWRSEGQKGHVDGAVTFHELDANMTRILLVLEYYPQGLFEKTGNIWRAQGRRARAEFKHFRRHVMTRSILHTDEIEGWRGRIEEGEVVETHEDAVEREEQEQQDQEQSEDQYGDEYESDEGEPEDESEEYDEGEYDEGEEPEGEYEEDYEEEEPEAEDGDEYEEEPEYEPAEGEPEPEEEPEAEDEPEAEEEPEAEDEPEAEEQPQKRPARRRRRAS